MAGSDSSVLSGNHGDEEPPVARAELRQFRNLLLEAMDWMFNKRLPTVGRGGGGRRADHNDRRAGGDRRNGHRVHFDDEEKIHSESENEEYDDNDNPFADHGHFGQHRDRRRGAGHDEGHHRGRHNRDNPDNIARVKLSVPKFSGREDADAYLEWEEQCDQIF